jgi:hypothetical protein
MKKITLLFTLLITSIGFSQTFAIYTENASIGAGLGGVRFSNGQGFSAPGSATESTTAPYEGTKSYLFTYNNTNSYIHGIMIGQNGTGGDVASDFSTYSYYNIAIKTVSEAPFYIRMRGNGITAKVLIDPALSPASVYGFDNDGDWHFLSIPFTAFIPESGTFSLTSVTEVFVLRSNAGATLVGGVNDDFSIDNIYLSTSQVLSLDDFTIDTFNMYPNPASNNLTIKSKFNIEKINIYNILGKKVLEVSPNTNNTNIDISAFKKGLYLVQMDSNGKSNTSKLVKN